MSSGVPSDVSVNLSFLAHYKMHAAEVPMMSSLAANIYIPSSFVTYTVMLVVHFNVGIRCQPESLVSVPPRDSLPLILPWPGKL